MILRLVPHVHVSERETVHRWPDQVMLAELPALDRLIRLAEAGEELPAEEVARVPVVREAIAATAMISPVAPTPAGSGAVN